MKKRRPDIEWLAIDSPWPDFPTDVSAKQRWYLTRSGTTSRTGERVVLRSVKLGNRVFVHRDWLREFMDAVSATTPVKRPHDRDRSGPQSVRDTRKGSGASDVPAGLLRGRDAERELARLDTKR